MRLRLSHPMGNTWRVDQININLLNPPVELQRTYFSWDQPLLTTCVEWLLADTAKDVADLRGHLLLLPTRQAGRRLREALAWEMHRRQGALFPPMTATPWHLVQPDEDAAPELVCLWHWERTLAKADLAKLKTLFPNPPTSASWHRPMARQLHELRGTLAEMDLDFSAVSEMDECPEAARWRDLKKLESSYRDSLGEQTDLHDAKRSAARQPELPPEIKHVTVIGVPDLPVIVQQALEQLMANGQPVELILFGPQDGENRFDHWGRPLPEYWNDTAIPLTEEQLITRIDESGQAAETSRRLAVYRDHRADHVAVGVIDPAITPPLERELADAAIQFFNPDGLPLRKAPLFVFLQSLQATLAEPTFANAEALLRLPDAWRWAGDRSATILQMGLDELREKHLPDTLADAANFYFADKDYRGARVEARDVLKELETALARIDSTPLNEGLTDFLKAAFDGRQFREGREEDAPDLEVAWQFMARLAEWETTIADSTSIPAPEALGLMLEIIGRESAHSERQPEAIDIQGWLELAWENAPHLILVGANEEHLPESVHGDVFLPETLRKQLGLRSNEERLARDAWLLELLLHTRQAGGHVDILLGRQRANGDPLKPSRLLFRCADEALPDRVQHLFTELPPAEQPPAWSAPWKLEPNDLPSIEKIGVTALAAYLDCPYRFFLKNILRMELPDLQQRELDARGFGSLVHAVLEAYGRDEDANQLKDADQIQAVFSALLKQAVKDQFGKRPPLPLRVQALTAERRLYQAAMALAQERANGWKIIRTEEQFEKELDGLIIKGRIDCVEENTKTGAVRVLDFKSSNTAKPPAQLHWKRMPREFDEDSVRPYARFELDGKAQHWIGLQLPLYAWALEAKFGTDVAAGFFNLPAIGTDTGVALLEPFDAHVRAAALECARGVADDLRAQRFWPAMDRVQYDDFEGILFGQPERTASDPGLEVA